MLAVRPMRQPMTTRGSAVCVGRDCCPTGRHSCESSAREGVLRHLNGEVVDIVASVAVHVRQENEPVKARHEI